MLIFFKIGLLSGTSRMGQLPMPIWQIVIMMTMQQTCFLLPIPTLLIPILLPNFTFGPVTLLPPEETLLFPVLTTIPVLLPGALTLRPLTQLQPANIFQEH